MMLRITSILLLLLAASERAQVTAVDVQNEVLSIELMSAFKHWVDFHGKFYATHEEKMQRLQNWVDNDERIRQHNEQVPPPTFTLGHNAYSDMTSEEFAQHFKLGKHSKFSQKEATEEALSTSAKRNLISFNDVAPLELPDYVNWVQLGAVTDIKNQGACGACWAFSTTGALEGAKFLKTGELVSLSEQNLLDCDHTDLGCNGGLMDNAFKFDEKSGGLCSEADYPYKASQNDCNTDCTDVPGTIVQTFVDVPPGDESALLAAVAMQPISIAIQADQFVFQFYKNGVLTDDSCGSRGDIDHGVLAVGYGTDLETNHPYFLVKNSWGTTWGDDGYVKLGRASKNEFGMCAILKMASFPVVEA